MQFVGERENRFFYTGNYAYHVFTVLYTDKKPNDYTAWKKVNIPAGHFSHLYK